MEFFQFLPIVTFLAMAMAIMGSRAAVSPEAYWNSVLPNTPMPMAVKDLLQQHEWVDDKSTSVDVGNGGVDVDAGRGKPSGGGTSVGVGKGGVTVGTGSKGKPVYVGVTPGPNPFVYKYAATDDQLHDNPNVALFFTEKDLKKGTEMPLHFTTSNRAATFLPRQVSEKIPFSSAEFPEILERFSVKPKSKEALIMEKSIKECEDTGIKGEEKYCATSLESMVDFSTSKLGKKVDAISTEVGKDTPWQKYTITRVTKLAGDKAVVCHKQVYPYAVFYCHKTQTTKAYTVSLAGADGTAIKAAAVCHTDTSAWNPKHLAFRVLKVEPGTVPICHFLPEDHVVWVPK
ncbi:hypothetical protein U1Q18_021778 [Sarracenia purpurea var. burkii]